MYILLSCSHNFVRYKSEYAYVLGHLIAVNNNFICYAVRGYPFLSLPLFLLLLSRLGFVRVCVCVWMGVGFVCVCVLFLTPYLGKGNCDMIRVIDMWKAERGLLRGFSCSLTDMGL